MLKNAEKPWSISVAASALDMSQCKYCKLAQTNAQIIETMAFFEYQLQWHDKHSLLFYVNHDFWSLP